MSQGLVQNIYLAALRRESFGGNKKEQRKIWRMPTGS